MQNYVSIGFLSLYLFIYLYLHFVDASKSNMSYYLQVINFVLQKREKNLIKYRNTVKKSENVWHLSLNEKIRRRRRGSYVLDWLNLNDGLLIYI